MKRDHKIDKINAYRKLLETKKLPKISILEDAETHHAVAKELHAEFESWVEGQIAVLLGEALANPVTSAPPFNDEEISILKTLVAGVKARKAATPSEETKPRPQIRPAPVKEERTISDAEKARLNSTAKPLGNRRMAEANKANTNDALISALDRMEDEGPNY